MKGQPALEVKDLKVYFQRDQTAIEWVRRRPRQVVKAVDGIDVELRRGEALGLVGESGSGKSTLARTIVGLQSPVAGEIRMHGAALPSKRARADRRRIQMVFQDPYSSLNPRMTVGQVLRELLLVHDIVPRSTAVRVSSRAGSASGSGSRARSR
jgi:oligopeptide transport system ATP-binding protein